MTMIKLRLLKLQRQVAASTIQPGRRWSCELVELIRRKVREGKRDVCKPEVPYSKKNNVFVCEKAG